MPSLYYDPGLWDELRDRVVEEITIRQRHICEGHWKSLEEAREMIGVVRGLTWVLEAAADMQQAPETKDEDE